ncbi:hypothetical protein LBMAG42_50010 [Deltaproteobacteria bacterium]|nr:hypothetical protein LBMAG42_50010 [Deltaproteobacteria bacterium]
MSKSPPSPARVAPPPQLLRDLGILGWESLEPLVVAALAIEAPILLIGPHGVAKSLLLERLAGALGSVFRHYNASTLNFDDLVGFPVPDGERVKYLRTPVDAWDAEAVFLDEINRCRPDMQNRLFPLIHERKLQGHPLPRLRHRWAAMNPPGAGEEQGWIGVERIDVALADRFPFVVETPEAPRGEDRIALIRGPEVQGGAAERLNAAVAEARGRRQTTEAVHGRGVAQYIDALADALAVAGIDLSGRRLRFLYDGVLAVIATERVPELRDAAFLAVRWAIPQRATGGVEELKLVAAHQAAWRYLSGPADPLRRALLGERDPLTRVQIAAGGDDELLTATLLDARAGLAPVERLALGSRIFPWLVVHRPSLPGVAYEALAEDVAKVNAVVEHLELIATHAPEYGLAGEISRAIAGFAADDAWIIPVLWAGFANKFTMPVPATVAFARRVASAFDPLQPAAAA